MPPTYAGQYSAIYPGGKSTADDQASLICTNVNHIRLLNLKSNDYRVLFRNVQRAVGIDYDYAKNIVFWTDVDNGAIYSGSLSGGARTELVGDLVDPNDVAVDWIHNTIYWVGKGLNSVGVARMDGSYMKTLFQYGLSDPRAISVIPLEGWMFWTDCGRVPKIERSGMDGTHRSVIVSQDIRDPFGLAIDRVLRRIFWTDGGMHEICSVDFDGSNKRVIISSWSSLSTPFALDVFEDTIYWVGWRTHEEGIYKANKNTGGNITTVVTGLAWIYLRRIRVHHESKQPLGPNRCGDENGGCSHLCLPAPDLGEGSSNYTCACPNGLFLSSDERNCSRKFRTRSTTYQPTYAPTTSKYPDQNSIESSLNPGVDWIIIGAFCALALIVLGGFFVYYRKYFRRGIDNSTINNPVSLSHLEDEFSLERNV